MKTLFIAWEDKNPPRWLTVARLCYSKNKYFFCYTKGAQATDKFVPFGRLLDLNKIYVSDKLFTLFENRILKSSRSEFKDLLNWLSLDDKLYDPLDILSLTEGRKATDNLEVFPYPTIDNNNILTINFFTRGVRYINDFSKKNLNSLSSGDRLFLCKDLQNPRDPNAILLRSDDPIIFAGYCPRYFTKDLNLLLESEFNNQIQVTVKKINSDAPYSYRILCTIKAKCPPEFFPFSDDQFSPIPKFESLECPNIDCKITCTCRS